MRRQGVRVSRPPRSRRHASAARRAGGPGARTEAVSRGSRQHVDATVAPNRTGDGSHSSVPLPGQCMGISGRTEEPPGSAAGPEPFSESGADVRIPREMPPKGGLTPDALPATRRRRRHALMRLALLTGPARRGGTSPLSIMMGSSLGDSLGAIEKAVVVQVCGPRARFQATRAPPK